MNQIMRNTKFIVLGLLALALLPAAALADQLRTETVSIQVNMTTPRGMTVIGTVIAKRTLGTQITTDISFNGMINGTPTSGTATAVENWLGNGQEDIEINQVTSWNSSIAAPQPASLHLEQDGPGLISVNGAPIAIAGLLEAPGSGRTSYVLSNAGQGSQPITHLPNMGAGPQSPANDLAGPVTVVALPGSAMGAEALFAVLLLVGASLGLAGLRLVAQRRGA